MKIVASLTTMPNRIDLIKPVLDSLCNQSIAIHHIEINVPHICVRTGETYVIPGWLETYPRVQIFRTEDYGAITKIAPTLLRYKEDSETYLWCVDDDINYNTRTLECLTTRHNPLVKRILAYSVGRLGKHGFEGCRGREQYDMLLEGFGTVLYPPGCIEDDFLSYVEKTSSIADCRVSDDVILSNYFFGKSIRIYCCPSTPTIKINIRDTLLSHFNDSTATHLQTGGHLNRYIRTLYHLKDLGMLYWKNQFPANNTIVTMKTNPPQRQPTVHDVPRPFVHSPLDQKKIQLEKAQNKVKKALVHIISPVRQVHNFALSCSSQQSGKRFWG